MCYIAESSFFIYSIWCYYSAYIPIILVLYDIFEKGFY